MKRQVGRRVGMRRRPTVFRPRPDVVGYAADFALPLPGSPSQVAFDAQHAAVAGHGTSAAAPRDDMIRLHVPQIEAFPADSTATLLRLVRGKPVGLGERADGKQTLI